MRVRIAAALSFAWLLAASCRLLVQEKLYPSRQIFEVGDGGGFDDAPTIVHSGDGSFDVAWISFRNGADSLQLARYSGSGHASRTVADRGW